MAGTTHDLRLVKDAAIDGQVAELVILLNALVDELEAMRVAINTANGGAIVIAQLTLQRLQALQDSIAAPPDGTVPDPETPGQTPTGIAVDGGDSQSAAPVTALSTALTVAVTDASAVGVPGVSVGWTSDDPGATFTAQSATNASGIASCVYTTGQAAGAFTVTATVTGVGSVTFAATTTAGTAAEIAAHSVTDQSGSTSSTVAVPPEVLVVDDYGNPVSGVTVTFAVTGGGGSRSPATVDTGADGLAALTSWTLGAAAGANTLTATAAGLTGSPVTFTASGVASAPTQIAVTAGGAQTGVVAGQVASATTVTVADAGDNPVEGVTVTFAVASGNGSLSAASAVTDVFGKASVTYTTDTTVETATLRASFTDGTGTPISTTTTIASTFGAAAQLAITTQPASNGSSGDALPGQPVITVQDANGNTVTSSTATITASVHSGNATISANSTQAAVAGVATFTTLTLVDVDGGVNVLRFSAGALTVADSDGTTLAPPVPVALQFVTQPSAVTTGQSTLSCAVWVVDDGNVVVPGATNAVTVALTTPGGATLSGTLTVNATTGVATFSGLGVDLAGTYTLTATSPGLTSAVSNSFTATDPGGSSLTPNLPAGLTLHIDSSLGGVALDTTMTNLTSGGNLDVIGIRYDGTGGNNCRIRSLSAQASWRNSFHAAFPACPNGYDLVHQCQFGTATGAAYTISAGEKGRYLMNLPANTKSLYLAGYFLIASNWYGQSGSGDWKQWYLRTQTEGPSILSFKGATTANIRTNAYVGAHWTNIVGASDTSLTEAVDNNTMKIMTRNTWYLVELLAVTESSSNAGDAHLTYWVDGVKYFQIVSGNLTTGGGGNLVWIPSCYILHYYGGGGTTSVPANNGPLCVLTGDHQQIWTSTSRVGVP